MVPIARRNLLADKVRLLISIGGVTFSVLLILVVRGLYAGFEERIGSFAERVPAELWVTEQDEQGFTYASNVPEAAVVAIAAVPGVALTVPLYAERLQLVTGGGRTDVYLIAYDPPAGVAAALGLELPAPGTIVIDRVFARDNGLDAGDELTIRGRTFRVARVAELADAGLSQFALISAADARQLIAVPGYVDYVLVRVNPGEDPAVVATAIAAAVPGVQASPKAAFAAINRTEVTATFRPVVGVLLLVSIAVGIAVVGLTIYTATIERAPEFGLLKALGASEGDLFRIVLTQSLSIGILGCVLGVPLAFAVNRVAERTVPEFITLLRWDDVLLVLAAAIAMAAVAALIPLRRILALDPVAVFRA